MAISPVQSVSSYQTGSSYVLTCAATGSGHLLVLAFDVIGGGITDPFISSITDNVGNTYINAPGTKASDGTTIWYCENCLPGATTVTITYNGSGFNNVWFQEFSGVKTSGSLDLTGNLNEGGSG